MESSLCCLTLACLAALCVMVENAHGVTVDKREPPLRVIHDDILIPEAEHAKLMSGSEAVRRSATTTGRLWKDAIVYYKFVPNTFKSWEIENIKKAMKVWEKESCLQFRESRGGSNYFLNIQRKWGGCNAIVGMAQFYAQSLNLDDGCTNMKTATHEVGHAIGFRHEHQRPDRDDYLIVYSQNAMDGLESAFTKMEGSEVYKEKDYDYLSIMHYSSFSFSKNGYPTMVSKDPAYSYMIGASEVPSFGDYRAVNRVYKCKEKFERRDRCRAKQCPEGSYVGPNCKCMCPDNVLQGKPVRECRRGETPSRPTPPTPGKCLDGRIDCSFMANEGDCSSMPGWMMRHCPVSCNRCSRDQSCQDKDKYCFKKAGKGECVSNPGYMNRNCPRACLKCNDGRGCKDRSKKCASWTKQGYCERDSTFMNKKCPNICKDRTCVNEKWQCDSWAASGECKKNPYMLGSCRKACKSCENYKGSKNCVKL